MNPVVAILIGLAIIGVIVFLVSRSRHSHDGVDSFRRQIDALSPEARRPVIDQMYADNGRSEPRIEPRIEQRPVAEPPRTTDSSPVEDSDRPDEDDSDGA